MDDGDGLLYMRARYYSTELMRFVNTDVVEGSPATPATLNRYAYANGNPMSYLDPLGRSAAAANAFSSADQMAQMVKKGQAPRTVERIDRETQTP